MLWRLLGLVVVSGGLRTEYVFLSLLQILQSIVFRIALLNHVKHLDHPLAVPGQELELIHHVFALLAVEQAKHVDVFLVAEVTHLAVVLRKSEALQQALQRFLRLVAAVRFTLI